MKFLSRLLLLFLLGWGSAYAQSNLPACQGGDVSRWSSCFGDETTATGNRYVGEFKDGRFNGQGTFFYLANDQFKGDKYVGEWKDNLRDGQGTYTHADGNKFVGNYKEGKRHGKGTITFKSGSVYVGEFRDGIRNGLGTMTFANGNKYVGDYKDDKYNGQGTETFADGGKYVGSFKDGKSDGQGTETFADGKKYIGEFKDNKINGQGTLYASNGRVLQQGIWADSKFVRSAPVQQATAPSAQTSSSERERINAEVEAERKKRQELEEQLRVAQQPNQPGKPTVSSVNERRVALVIGNATYKINPLKNPVNDSTDMARSLRSVGFDVIEANNTTLIQMREATRRFADKLGNSDVGLVYYSGHGVEVKGKNYLIPVNADIKREYEVVDQAFDASQFLEMMDNIRGPNNKRVNILIVDACRNNELQKSWRSTNNGLARMDAPGGTFISFATAPGRVAADGVGRNSPYTKHLLQALKQPNVPIEQVFKVVRRNVMEETKGEQIPWENSSLVGDFYFTVQK